MLRRIVSSHDILSIVHRFANKRFVKFHQINDLFNLGNNKTLFVFPTREFDFRFHCLGVLLPTLCREAIFEKRTQNNKICPHMVTFIRYIYIYIYIYRYIYIYIYSMIKTAGWLAGVLVYSCPNNWDFLHH